jgi:hypothetical protein
MFCIGLFSISAFDILRVSIPLFILSLGIILTTKRHQGVN